MHFSMPFLLLNIEKMVKEERRRLFLVSNMYPSNTNLRYGIFIKRFEEALVDDFKIEKIVLTKKIDFWSKTLGYFFLFFKVFKLFFKAKKDDIVYVHFPLYFSTVLAPFVWKGVPLILNFHGSDIVLDTLLKRFLMQLLKPIARKCNKVVVPSNYYKEKVMALFRLSEKNLFVYPSGGVDGKIFYSQDKENDVFVYGFVSNFIRTKGWVVFLEALSNLKTIDTILPFKAIMVGDGPEKDKIESEINARKLDVKLIQSVEQSKLAEIYGMFDVFVFPTYREEESLGLVGLEALMCGIPVIATRIGGPLGYIIDGYNGFLFNKKNSKDLAKKMRAYQNFSKEDQMKMKLNAVQSVADYESLRVKKRLLQMLNEL